MPVLERVDAILFEDWGDNSLNSWFEMHNLAVEITRLGCQQLALLVAINP